LKADVVIGSHEDEDHTNFSLVEGSFEKLVEFGSFTVNDVSIELCEGSHGTLEGQSLGTVRMALIKADGLTILHCSDLQVIPTGAALQKLMNLDIVLCPVGGGYTFGPEKAKEFLDMIKPKIAIPMHYKTDRLTIPLDPSAIGNFEKLCPNMENLGKSELVISKADISDKCRIIKMNYA
ncbi:MAG: MBL fold metallo-hydrolase, partial [Candidatus Cloacimonetes bacterium]|nr:MBL fold metallo-hydrolase [Candidatus Cloacimonadota bacterium]